MEERTNLGGGIHMAHVCSDTRCATDIIEAQRRDEWVALEQQRERLADASSSAEDCYFCLASSRGGEETSRGGTEGSTTKH